MGDLVQNFDRQATAVALLIDIFQSKEKFVQLLSSYTEQTQELEDAIFQVFYAFYVGTAVGEQLEAIGEIVGEGRGGLSDADYRVRIRTRILINKSSGTINDILTIMELTLGNPLATFHYQPDYPAGFTIDINGVPLTPTQADTIGLLLDSLTPAGVRYNSRYAEVDDGVTDPNEAIFRFSSNPTTPSTDAARGFAPTNQTAGGHFAGILTNGGDT